jgi:hypothetical protein
MSENIGTYININRDGISYAYNAHFIKEENGMISAYIPAFDIYFSAADRETASKRGSSLVTSFFSFWIKQQGFRSFVLQILKLGFKAPNAGELKQLLERKNINTRLKSIDIIPKEFLESELAPLEGQLEVAM